MTNTEKAKPGVPAGRNLQIYLKKILRRIADFFGFSLYAIATTLVGISVWAAGASVIKSGWNSDAAAWIQAAGSITAIVGSAWIAQSEARRARRQRREQNEEAAWYVRFAIRQAQVDSHIIAAELVNRTKPIELSDVREWRQRATTAATGLSSFLGRTDHVHPSVTHVLSNAKVIIDDLMEDLNILNHVLEDGHQPSHDLLGSIVSPHRVLLELIDLYDDRMRGVRQVLDDGDDALPIKAWAPWNPENR